MGWGGKRRRPRAPPREQPYEGVKGPTLTTAALLAVVAVSFACPSTSLCPLADIARDVKGWTGPGRWVWTCRCCMGRGLKARGSHGT